MKRYLFIQWLQRLIYGGAIVVIVLLICFFAWYMYSKPTQSKITLTDYSRILFDDQDCSKIDMTSATLSDQFPITLSYEPNSTKLKFSTETDFFNARLQVSGAEEVFVTIDNSSYLGGDSDPETILLPYNKNVVFEIQAKGFEWNTNILPGDFEEVKGIAPRPTPTPIPTSSYDSNYDDLWDYSDCLSDCGYEEPGEFDWIPSNTKVSYSVGLCGENLAYYPRYQTASLDNLYSVGMNVRPLADYQDLHKTAFLITFNNLVDIKSNGQSIPIGKRAVIRIVMNIPDEENNVGGANSPLINMVATQISSRITNGDYVSGSWPGAVDSYVIDNYNNKNDNNIFQNIYIHGFEGAKINTNRLFVDEPRGSVISNYPKTLLPENADQIIIYSTSKPLKFELDSYSPYNEIKEVLLGERMGALLDGRELFPSPWEAIPSDLQVAYITVFIPLLAALIGYGINKRHSIDSFFDWLFSIPRYRRPIKLHDDAHIFQLINGKKISGIIETFEGRSTFRVFVLTEVREWDKDNWGEVLPTEVRVPQNQIEMYYKAHP